MLDAFNVPRALTNVAEITESEVAIWPTQDALGSVASNEDQLDKVGYANLTQPCKPIAP